MKFGIFSDRVDFPTSSLLLSHEDAPRSSASGFSSEMGVPLSVATPVTIEMRMYVVRGSLEGVSLIESG